MKFDENAGEKYTSKKKNQQAVIYEIKTSIFAQNLGHFIAYESSVLLIGIAFYAFCGII